MTGRESETDGVSLGYGISVLGRVLLVVVIVTTLTIALGQECAYAPPVSAAYAGGAADGVLTDEAGANEAGGAAGAYGAWGGVDDAWGGADGGLADDAGASGADSIRAIDIYMEGGAPPSHYIHPNMEAAESIIDGFRPVISVISNIMSASTAQTGGAAVSDAADGAVRDAAAYDAYDGRVAVGDAPFSGLNGHMAAFYGFTGDVASTHQALLDRRADALSYVRQLAAAKYLSQSSYQAELAWRAAFIEKHGKSGDELSEQDISKLYGNDYFMQRLDELGFYRNDKYGRDVNRRNAIIRAQSASNIPITARIDLNTKRALIEGTNFVPKDFINCEHPEGMWVVIDKSARILTVYIGDAVWMKFPVAVGSNITLTPEGKFTFASKAVNPRWGGGGYASPVAGGAPNNPLGKRWMGLSKGGGGLYGVHGNVNAYSIGTNASHGCIRMINSDVEFLYDFIKIGTPVWVGTTAKINEWGIYQLLGCWAPDPPDYLDFLPQQPLYHE